MRKNTTILLFLAISAASITFSCNSTKPVTENKPAPVAIDTLETLVVTYNSPWMGITVENKKVTMVTTTHYFNKNNFSSVPDSTSTETTVDGKTLSDSTLNVLMNILDEQDFWELNDNYGAPESQRFYPYVLSARTIDQFKKVTFRSNPGYDLAPKAFTDLENFLKNLGVEESGD